MGIEGDAAADGADHLGLGLEAGQGGGIGLGLLARQALDALHRPVPAQDGEGAGFHGSVGVGDPQLGGGGRIAAEAQQEVALPVHGNRASVQADRRAGFGMADHQPTLLRMAAEAGLGGGGADPGQEKQQDEEALI